MAPSSGCRHRRHSRGLKAPPRRPDVQTRGVGGPRALQRRRAGSAGAREPVSAPAVPRRPRLVAARTPLPVSSHDYLACFCVVLSFTYNDTSHLPRSKDVPRPFSNLGHTSHLQIRALTAVTELTPPPPQASGSRLSLLPICCARRLCA